jgi:hypothetical protein
MGTRKTDIEDWRSIPSFASYEASSNGLVRRIHGNTLTPRGNGRGYMRVTVSQYSIISHPYVHRLVCEAFHGPCPIGMETRHINGVRADNRSTNLAWATKAENELDKIAHGTWNFGERQGSSILTDDIVRELRKNPPRIFEDAANELGVSRAAIGDALAGRRWAHLPGALPPRKIFRKIAPPDRERIKNAIINDSVDMGILASQYGVAKSTIYRIAYGRKP